MKNNLWGEPYLEYTDILMPLIKKINNYPLCKIEYNPNTKGGFHIKDENSNIIEGLNFFALYVIYYIHEGKGLFLTNKEKFVAYCGVGNLKNRISRYIAVCRKTNLDCEDHPGAKKLTNHGYDIHNLYLRFYKMDNDFVSSLPAHISPYKLDERLAYLIGSRYNTKVMIYE